MEYRISDKLASLKPSAIRPQETRRRSRVRRKKKRKRQRSYCVKAR